MMWPLALEALLRAGVRFLVVGAHAMAVRGVPRVTGGLNVRVRCDAETSARSSSKGRFSDDGACEGNGPLRTQSPKVRER